MKKTFVILLSFTLLSFSAFAHTTSKKEFKTVNRVADLCNNCGDSLKVLVVYAKENSTSEKDKQHILEYAKYYGLKNVDATYKLTDDIKNYNLILLTNGLDINKMRRITQHVKGKKIITASTNSECIDEDACLLSVEVSNSINIMLNEHVYKESSIKFNDDLYLLIN